MIVVGAVGVACFRSAFTAAQPEFMTFVGGMLALATLAALVGGLRFAWRTVYSTLLHRPRLVFARFPFLLGESLEAELELAAGGPNPRRLRATVTCVQELPERLPGGDDGQTILAQYPVWWRTVPVSSREERRFLVRVRLPDRPELGTLLSCQRPRYWQVEVDSDDERVRATFVVPVYARPGRREGDRARKGRRQVSASYPRSASRARSWSTHTGRATPRRP
jgi:hypothetical protein